VTGKQEEWLDKLTQSKQNKNLPQAVILIEENLTMGESSKFANNYQSKYFMNGNDVPWIINLAFNDRAKIWKIELTQNH